MIFFLHFVVLSMIFVHGTCMEGEYCFSAGRFRHRDATCRKYYLCVQFKGSYVMRDYICPPSAIFNPSTNLCSVKAVCIDNICDNVPSTASKIPDPNGTGCKTYIECKGNQNRYPVIRTCKKGFFNKSLRPEPGCSSSPDC